MPEVLCTMEDYLMIQELRKEVEKLTAERDAAVARADSLDSDYDDVSSALEDAVARAKTAEREREEAVSIEAVKRWRVK